MLGPRSAAWRGQPRSPGLLNRKARRARRTSPHRTARRHLRPLWSASPGRTDGGLPRVAAKKGTVPQEPVPPTATNPSRQRLLRGPLPRTLARESDAGPSGCGRGALLAGPRARLAPLPHLLLQDACPRGSGPWATLGDGGLGHILAFQGGQGPDEWQRELGEIWGLSITRGAPATPERSAPWAPSGAGKRRECGEPLGLGC